MAFFEPPPEREEPRPTPQPEWLQPPDNELGLSLPFRRVAVRTEAIAIVVDGLVAYSTGFSFRLAGRSRPEADGRARVGFDLMFHPRSGQGELMSQLLLGVEFADGRKATTLTIGPPQDRQPTITNRGGGSGGGRFDTEYWVWPLPPPGDLVLALQWDGQGIPLTRVDLTEAAIREAATASEPLWPDRTSDAGSTRRSSQIAWSRVNKESP
jgi:hypothetical protein